MIHARQALLPGGWHKDVRVEMAGGRITSVQLGVLPKAGDIRADCLVPGMPNVHSHAFQRGFSGLTERRGQGRESFWTWREMMYRFALSVTPEDVQALAEMAYIEMLEAGFTRVGEFHYLHHDRDGARYANPAELSLRIFAAAESTGIALTHLPVFYAHGGFGPQPAGDGQRRFLNDLDSFADIVSACEARLSRPQDSVGYAPHSLRAASGDELISLTQIWPDKTVHIHIAEQVKEVEDCLAFSGRRPVEWLLENLPVNDRWCLIHATHLTEQERRGIAASGAVAGLCPVTEANLGDGLFPAVDFLTESGRIAIGTDSNIRIDLAEELRVLEYGQRLFHRERNLLADEGGSTGMHIFAAALNGGTQAMGAAPAQIAVDAPADLVALQDALDLGAQGDALLDRWIFGRNVAVADVWAAGAHVVRRGRHVLRDRIEPEFAAVLRRALEWDAA